MAGADIDLARDRIAETLWISGRHASSGSLTAWALGYASAVVAVHHVLAKRRAHSQSLAVPMLAFATVALAMVVPGLAIGIPLLVTATAIAIRLPSPRRLRLIGIGLVVPSVVSALLVITVVGSS